MAESPPRLRLRALLDKREVLLGRTLEVEAAGAISSGRVRGDVEVDAAAARAARRGGRRDNSRRDGDETPRAPRRGRD